MGNSTPSPNRGRRNTHRFDGLDALPVSRRLGLALALGCAASNIGCASEQTTRWRMPELKATAPGPNEAAGARFGEGAREPTTFTEPGDLPDEVRPHADPLWHDDYATTKAEAQRTQRPMLVLFAADWCVPCRLLEADTLSDPRVRERLATHLVVLRIDVTEETHANREQQSRFRVRGLPTLVFLDPDGQPLDRLEGYISSSAFLARIEGLSKRFAH